MGLADAAAASWQEADQGIWEIRGEPRHYLYSKLMCWVALDRATELAPLLGAEAEVEAWSRSREEIRSTIIEHGWNAEVGAFTQVLGGSELDASSLLISSVGFLPPDDSQVLGTIEATDKKLTDVQGLVYRYLVDDGLAEEVDPSSGELLGNFPQAFSHVGLINAAWAISQAEEAQQRERR